MSLFVEEKSGVSIPPLAEDSYPAVCIAVIDLGDQYSEAYAKWTRKVAIGWEVIGETITIDGETLPRTFYNIYTASLSSKGVLRKDLISWRGRDFTVEELKKFDLRNILGAPCFIQIVHKKSTDGTKTYANLAAVTKVPKGLPKPEATLPLLSFDIDTDGLEILENVPDWIKERVTKSRSYSVKSPEITETDDDEELPL